MPAIQPAKMMHMTSAARQTKVIVNHFNGMPDGVRPGEGWRTRPLRVNSPSQAGAALRRRSVRMAGAAGGAGPAKRLSAKWADSAREPSNGAGRQVRGLASWPGFTRPSTQRRRAICNWFSFVVRFAPEGCRRHSQTPAEAPARSAPDRLACSGAFVGPRTGSETAAFVVDLRRRHIVHHAEKRLRDGHWRAGLVAIDEENEAAGIAVNLGERRLVTVGQARRRQRVHGVDAAQELPLIRRQLDPFA